MDHFLVQAIHAERLASIDAAAGPRRRAGRRPRAQRRRRLTGRLVAPLGALATALVAAWSANGAASHLETGP